MQRRTALMQMVSMAAMLALRRRVGAEETKHWGYEGPTGPEHWADAFPACAGSNQSPVDIRTVRKVRSHPLEFHYADSGLRVINNGHTLQVNYDAGSFLTRNGIQYNLVQFHFHRPSEERIRGRSFPFVAHLVHQNSAGDLAVVAVLFGEGPAHPLIGRIWEHIPTTVDDELVADIRINVAELLPKSHVYYHYMGSLTTPPCTEGVSWNILTTPIALSAAQLSAFPFKRNARPIQPLNGRIVEEN